MSIDKELLTELREVLQKEIKAKELYEKNLPRFSDPRLRETIASILEEEKEHEKKARKLIGYVKSSK